MARKLYSVNQNGDFENTTDGVTPWFPTGAALATTATPGNPPWEGVQSLQVTPDGTTADVQVVSEAFAIQAGRTVELTGSMYSAEALSAAFPRVSWYDSSGAFITTTGGTYAPLTAGQWNTRTATTQAPANAASCRINVGVQNTPTAVFLLDEMWLIGQYQLDISGTATPRPDGRWDVDLALATDANAQEYDAWMIRRATVQQTFLLGQMPATYEGTQDTEGPIVWDVALYKRIQTSAMPQPEWVPIAFKTAPVTGDQPPGKSLIITADGSAYTWVEIQSWPERRFTRRSTTLPIIGSVEPVVTNDVVMLPTQSPVFITRTINERNALAQVLAAAGPHHLIPACEELVDQPWFMPLDFNQVRYQNRASNTVWLTELAFQEVNAPTPPAAMHVMTAGPGDEMNTPAEQHDAAPAVSA